MLYWQKKISTKLLTAAAITLWLLTGCVTQLPSDIQLDELEKKMALAIDPEGVYRKTESYYQRQNVVEKGFFSDTMQLVEVRFQRPDKFKFSYYEKNRPVRELLCLGSRAWNIDHSKGTVTEITGDALEKFRIMLALGHPDTDYDKLFAKVEIFLTKLEDGKDYYQLICHPALKGANPITVYVDKNTFLHKRMELTVSTANGNKSSVSDIESYRKFGKLNLAELTRVTESDREYTTRIVEYHLNAHFSSDTFELPVFDPVLMEMKKQQERLR